MPKLPPPCPAVPRRWPGATFVLCASGPSLTRDDVAHVAAAHVAGAVRVVVVNTTYELAPWAEVLYACDASWWATHPGAAAFGGLKYALEPAASRFGAVALRNTGARGLEASPTGLRTGRNSGYQAINLAVHLGAARIVLLGYDLQLGPHGETHWHRPHPQARRSPLADFRPYFATLAAPLAEAGVEVVNATRRTALDVWPHVALEDALTFVPAGAA